MRRAARAGPGAVQTHARSSLLRPRVCVCFLQGKQKYTLPLYHAMMGGSEVAQTLAKETFKATAPQLHSNVVNYVQQIVAPKGS